MTIVRDRIQTIHNNSIAVGNDIQTSPVIPTGQVWQITRIIFADKAINDGMSGGFQVDFGTGSTREIIMASYLLGNTIAMTINKTFTGDGVKVFRYIRTNNGAMAKDMFLMVEGFKRIGDI